MSGPNHLGLFCALQFTKVLAGNLALLRGDEKLAVRAGGWGTLP